MIIESGTERRATPQPSEIAYLPLSVSPLWALQRAYFEINGPGAWASGTVPHQVTSNPDMARSLAEVVVGFAADRARATAAPALPLRPLYLIELGAGVGRLGFHMTRVLRAAAELRLLGWRPVYVMTDLAEATVAWWQAHPWLAPLAAAGLIDFARFDCTADDAIELRVSGHRITARAPAPELIVIANYLFDSLPHDVFAYDRDALQEWTVAASGGPAPAPGDELTWEPWDWRPRPVARPRYADPIHDALLDEYRGRTGYFTVPIAGLAALDRLRTFTSGPMLLLSADKGAVTAADAVEGGLPAVVCHGSVSMRVNYHAIGAWTLAHGGTWMHADHHGHALEVCAFVLGAGRAASVPATVAAFDRAVARRAPDDLHALKRVIVANAPTMTLEELLAYLRLVGHDPRVFLACADALRAAVGDAGPTARADLGRALARVWDSYLPIGEDTDVAFALARVYAALGEHHAALALLAASRDLHGEHADATALAAACRADASDLRAGALW